MAKTGVWEFAKDLLISLLGQDIMVAVSLLGAFAIYFIWKKRRWTTLRKLFLTVVVAGITLALGYSAWKYQNPNKADMTSQQPVTAQEIVVGWLNTAGYSVRILPPYAEHTFIVGVTTLQDIHLDVFQLKNDPKSLIIETDIGYPDFIVKLDPIQRHLFELRMRKELLQHGITTYVNPPRLNGVLLQADFPYDEHANWLDLAHHVDFVASSVSLIRVLFEETEQTNMMMKK